LFLRQHYLDQVEGIISAHNCEHPLESGLLSECKGTTNEWNIQIKTLIISFYIHAYILYINIILQV